MNDYQSLLGRVALLYKRHEAGRRKPFNVFSVLRSPSDEVNLHSRFLHALLDYRKSPEAERENLKDFLQHVAEKQFEEKGAKVERERNYIDILITNEAMQAVVIENKIWSGYRHEQLQRYYEKLQEMDYRDIHLLYLTPHGDESSEDSVGDLYYKPLSYKGDLLPWLERCQQRAYDEPALRASVAQYRQLVRKLTGTDLTGANMSELKKLLLQDNNLVLSCHLMEAMLKARIELWKKMWDEIDSELKETIPDLPQKANNGSDLLPKGEIVTENRIRNYVKKKKNSMHYGLYYPFGDDGVASLGVEIGHTIYFGIRCYKEAYGREYERLEKTLKDVSGGQTSEWWPWFKYPNKLDLREPTQENLELLSNEEKRSEYVKGIARGLADVWKKLKAEGLAR